MNLGGATTHDLTFTADPEKIKRIRANMAEGKKREELPTAVREKLDMQALHVTNDHLAFLRERAGLTDAAPTPSENHAA